MKRDVQDVYGRPDESLFKSDSFGYVVKKTSFLFLKPWELREPRLLVVCVLRVHSDSAGPLQTLVLIPNHYFKIIPNAW